MIGYPNAARRRAIQFQHKSLRDRVRSIRILFAYEQDLPALDDGSALSLRASVQDVCGDDHLARSFWGLCRALDLVRSTPRMRATEGSAV